MKTIAKAIATTFFVMAQVILIICFMEIADEVSHTDFMLFGIILCVSCTGCLGAAVAINSKG